MCPDRNITHVPYALHYDRPGDDTLVVRLAGSWKLEDASGKGPEGKDMVLWKKNGSTWQLYRDMWSGNAPPPPAPAPAPAPAAAPAGK